MLNFVISIIFIFEGIHVILPLFIRICHTFDNIYVSMPYLALLEYNGHLETYLYAPLDTL